jgi:uncharacterized protein YpuA (DUF1002 family)
MKEYLVTIRIESGQFLEAEDKEDAIERVKKIWEEEYNIHLNDNEIVDVQEVNDENSDAIVYNMIGGNNV